MLWGVVGLAEHLKCCFFNIVKLAIYFNAHLNKKNNPINYNVMGSAYAPPPPPLNVLNLDVMNIISHSLLIKGECSVFKKKNYYG